MASTSTSSFGYVQPHGDTSCFAMGFLCCRLMRRTNQNYVHLQQSHWICIGRISKKIPRTYRKGCTTTHTNALEMRAKHACNSYKCITRLIVTGTRHYYAGWACSCTNFVHNVGMARKTHPHMLGFFFASRSPPRLDPPPPHQNGHSGKKRNLQSEKSRCAIFGTQTFGSQTLPPPPIKHSLVCAICRYRHGTTLQQRLVQCHKWKQHFCVVDTLFGRMA